MSDGTTAGMVSGRDLAAEMAVKRERERERFARLDAETTGRGAQTVFRDLSGAQVSREKYLAGKKAQREAAKAKYDDESQLAWGGGLRQRAEAEAEAERVAADSGKLYAPVRHDAELDAAQRDALRWGDPMAHLVKNKVVPEVLEPPSLAAARAEAMKRSGFVVPLEVPQHSWLRRGVGVPPNRYGIKPGRHWDGVDRSNGFERDMYRAQVELKRREQQAFAWAQEDM
jgi:pre-mRNA-splicing factor CWC26